MLDELVRGGEAPNAEREEDPAPSVGRLGRVVGQLLADLAIDLVAQLGPEDAVADDEVKLFEVGSRTRLEPRVVRVCMENMYINVSTS
jgi:hypothetical protein